MKLALIPTGEFWMGSPDNDTYAGHGEKPQHRVRITRPFYLGATEVTVGQFRRVMENADYRTDGEREGGLVWNDSSNQWSPDRRRTWRSPGFEQTDDHPVVQVSWVDAVVFCNKLSKLEGLRPNYQLAGEPGSDGEGYRLPTEAEWEYACRAGGPTRYCFGDDASSLGEYAWFRDNSGGRTHPVGEKRANAYGLRDMHGNVEEWCSDWEDDDYYRRSPTDNPPGPPTGGIREQRGGTFGYEAGAARLRRWANGPHFRVPNLGFRVARSIPEKQRNGAQTNSLAIVNKSQGGPSDRSSVEKKLPSISRGHPAEPLPSAGGGTEIMGGSRSTPRPTEAKKESSETPSKGGGTVPNSDSAGVIKQGGTKAINNLSKTTKRQEKATRKGFQSKLPPQGRIIDFKLEKIENPSKDYRFIWSFTFSSRQSTSHLACLGDFLRH